MSPVSFPEEHMVVYDFIDWERLGEIAYRLAGKILASRSHKFDRVIALSTGGHTMSKAVKDYLDIGKISSMQITFYTDINTRQKTPIIAQSVATSIEGDRILVFDDINDTGGSLTVAVEYLKMCGAKSVKTATLFQKPQTAFPSDYWGEETDSWIIFPDEIRETISILTKKWQKTKISEAEMLRRLHKIGFTDKHIHLIRGTA